MHTIRFALLLPQICNFLIAYAFPSTFQPRSNKFHDSLRSHWHSLEKRLSRGDLSTPLDVSGEHTFIAPDFEAGDQRGPCPGLNALANHGYLPHNGIVTFEQALGAVYEVYGMGIDLGSVLVAIATVFVGDPLSLNPSFSIGGKDDRIENVLDNVGGIIGTSRGLEGSHNFIETDGSLTRDDLYVTGNAWDMNMTKFLQVYHWNGEAALTFEDIGDISAMRWKEAEFTNPYFWYGPVSGYIPRTGGYALTVRTMSNYSAEKPEGEITKDMLKSFWGVYDDESTEGMVYKRGWERVPENWYRRPIPWGLVDLNIDVLTWGSKYPFLLNIGGNAGMVDSFTGIDLSNLTGGALNTVSLLEGNNLVCLALQVAKTFGPNSLSSLYSAIEGPMNFLSENLGLALLSLNCLVYGDLANNGQAAWDNIIARYPGADGSQ